MRLPGFAYSSSFPSQWITMVFICCAPLAFLPWRIQAQAATDPTEVSALNTMFDRWGIQAMSTWNLTGDPCTGGAVDDSVDFGDTQNNPFIKCECINNTVCHITQLKVYALDVTGPVPEELLGLPRLFNLNLGQNYLTGPLPSFIGNLTDMQYLSFGINALSGSIPKELGNLSQLLILGMGSNDFTGPLPVEFGNLINLQQLYMDSSGISGELPSTFANLVKLNTMWASSNNFTGTIPDYFGNFTQLNTLRLQGSSFQGPIPLSLANLVNLTDLRIGDLTNDTSSSLSFIDNMTDLSTLVIRNCMISNAIPQDFGSYANLQFLDLSFNNLTGQVPQSLFNLPSLSFLFLGNNSLSGDLPTQKASNLLNVDLSYNNLSGSFPSWVSEDNLNLNLVANNFGINISNSESLPGLRCLQKTFPCNRGSPLWSSFAINCGDSRGITSSDGISYDPEDETLTAASYYVSSTERWGVSNVGTFLGSPNGTYVDSSSSQITNTLNPELFQTARISPSSLRYYGLGLENGNYTVRLKFAELAIQNGLSWQSVGKRIFDIYIQGNLAVKDFNIKDETRNTRTMEKSYFANVTENFLEIHLFWAGKGTCCIPDQGTYGPLISAISVTPNFVPTVSNALPSSNNNNNTGLIVGLVVGIAALCALLVLGFFIWRQKKLKDKLKDDEELVGLATKANIFSFAELRIATDDFDPNNKLGEGGYGAVFKGKFQDGREIAVKQLSVTSHQGKREFIAEIETISAVRHRNLVKLYGCCIEGTKRLLVYEYLEKNSLDQTLFGKSDLVLDWPSRFAICLGTARGLAYLHEESSVRIVHRDVKASNILLDAEFNPKISDFGLAKLYDDKKTHISTRVAGTVGYLAPEYALRGHLTEKADVFGFGVVVLEILTGRLNTDPSLGAEKVYLLDWAWNLFDSNNGLEMMDRKLSSYDEEEAIRIIHVALLCTHTSPTMRPSMSRVVNMLTGETQITELTSKPSYLTEWQLGDSSSSLTRNLTPENVGSHEIPAVRLSSSTSNTQPMLSGVDGEGR